jgi:hypothetical protein
MAKQNRKKSVKPVKGKSVEFTKSVVLQDKSPAKPVKRSTVEGVKLPRPGYNSFVRKRVLVRLLSF